jgi:hypothetical protein
MSEQHKEQNPTKQPETPKLDSTSAAAALAMAVTSAKNSGGKPAGAVPAKDAASSGQQQTSPVAEWRTYAARAAAIVVAMGLGWAGGSQAMSGAKKSPQVIPEWADAATSGIRQNQEDLVRLTGDVRVLKSIVESMKESFDEAKAEAAGERRSTMERVDGIGRTAQETAAKIARVADASDRIERASTDAGVKLAALSGRLDGIERQAAAAPAAAKLNAFTADGPPQTGSVPEAKAASKDMPLDGWVLHDVQGGVALIENRNGRLHEVVAGQNLPTVGRVEAIERRGRAWVVVTSKGLIGAPTRWQ